MFPAFSTYGRSLAVDEAAGNIYIGEKLNGQITVINVPAPAGAAAVVIAAGGVSVRRRRLREGTGGRGAITGSAVWA